MAQTSMVRFASVWLTTMAHVEQNLFNLKNTPLCECCYACGIDGWLTDALLLPRVAGEVLKVLDEAWLSMSPYATPYFH